MVVSRNDRFFSGPFVASLGNFSGPRSFLIFLNQILKNVIADTMTPLTGQYGLCCFLTVNFIVSF